jgi:hypothetical protein
MANPGGQKLFNRFILNNPAQTSYPNEMSTLNHQSSIGQIPSSATISKPTKRLGTTKVATPGYAQATLNVLPQGGSTNLKAKENSGTATP